MRTFDLVSPSNIIFKITAKVEGPNGGHGVKYIQIGYIQNVSVTSFHASFIGGKTRTRSLEGHKYVDVSAGSSSPWYASGDSAYTWSPTDNGTHDFNGGDLPDLNVVTTLDDTNTGAFIKSATIVEAFSMFLAVHTTEAINSSDKIYTERAKADWNLDYSGTINADGTLYLPSAAIAITGPTGAKFTTITDGTTVEKTDGTTANDELAKKIWTTSP